MCRERVSKSHVQTEVVLVTSGRIAVNVTLAIGEVTEKIEVTSQPSQVKTLTAQVGKVVAAACFGTCPSMAAISPALC